MTPTTRSSLTRSEDLDRTISLLASVEPSDAAFLNCYLDLSEGESGYRHFLEVHARRLRETLCGVARGDFEDALVLIEHQLDGFHPRARGLAIFARGPSGGRFVLGMQFPVSVESGLTVYPAPDVYPLLEVKNIQDRIEFQERQSRRIAARLVSGDLSRGLAVTGGSDTLQALRERRADTLVIARGYGPESGWLCGHCGENNIQDHPPEVCPACGRGQLHALNLRAELVRLAGQQGVAVELVDSAELLCLGGVASLLRHPAESPVKPGPEDFARLGLVA